MPPFLATWSAASTPLWRRASGRASSPSASWTSTALSASRRTALSSYASTMPMSASSSSSTSAPALLLGLRSCDRAWLRACALRHMPSCAPRAWGCIVFCELHSECGHPDPCCLLQGLADTECASIDADTMSFSPCMASDASHARICQSLCCHQALPQDMGIALACHTNLPYRDCVQSPERRCVVTDWKILKLLNL